MKHRHRHYADSRPDIPRRGLDTTRSGVTPGLRQQTNAAQHWVCCRGLTIPYCARIHKAHSCNPVEWVLQWFTAPISEAQCMCTRITPHASGAPF
jgi:hypothetical protein